MSVINTVENKTKKDEPLMQFVTDCKGQFCQTRQGTHNLSYKKYKTKRKPRMPSIRQRLR